MDIKTATTEQLAQRLVDLKKEEQAIMLELWNRAPKVDKEHKVLVKEMKPNEPK